MYSEETETIIKKLIEERPAVLSISVRDIAAEIEKRTGRKPSISTVKIILNRMGIVAVDGKKRAWVWK